MDVTEICPLTRQAVRSLLASRGESWLEPSRNGKRRAIRWPFPGTIELWVPDDAGSVEYGLGTCLDLSPDGVGVRCEQELEIDRELEIAIHQPEVSFHGRAVVRHCTPTVQGDYLVGMEFAFAGGRRSEARSHF